MFVFGWLILQIKIIKNSFRQKKRQFLFRFLLRTAMLIFWLILLSLFFIYMFDFSRQREMPPFDFAASLFSFSLLVFMPLLIYSSIVCALYFLFQKEEIGFLFSLPVKKMQVFSVKFLQTFYKSSWMVFCGILTFVITIQIYFRVPILIYFGGIIASIAYLLIPVGIGVIATLILSRIFPFARAKDLLIVIGLFIGSLVLLSVRMMQPERLITVEGRLRLLTFVQGLHTPWKTLLPSEWLNNVLVSYYQSDVKGIWINILALSTAAFLLLAIIYILARSFYVRAWTESITIPAAALKGYRWKAFLNFFPAHLRSFIKKDLLTFYRDTVERGSLLLFIPMSILYFYSIYVLGSFIKNYGCEDIFSFLYKYLFNIFYAGVVLSGLAGRWVFPSITTEGANFRLLRLGSVSLRDFVKEKLWLGFMPLVILGEVLALGSCFIMGISWGLTIAALIITLALAFGIVGIGVILGAKMADFTIKEPLDFVLGYHGIIFIMVELSFIIAVVILVGIPLSVYLKSGLSPLSLFTFFVSLLGFSSVFYFGIYLPYKEAVIYLERQDI